MKNKDIEDSIEYKYNNSIKENTRTNTRRSKIYYKNRQ